MLGENIGRFIGHGTVHTQLMNSPQKYSFNHPP